MNKTNLSNWKTGNLVNLERALRVGDEIMSSDSAEIKTGNSMMLKDIPLGTNVHCIELKPLKGANTV